MKLYCKVIYSIEGHYTTRQIFLFLWNNVGLQEFSGTNCIHKR